MSSDQFFSSSREIRLNSMMQVEQVTGQTKEKKDTMSGKMTIYRRTRCTQKNTYPRKPEVHFQIHTLVSFWKQSEQKDISSLMSSWSDMETAVITI